MTILIRRDAVWAVRPVTWPRDHPCRAFYEDNRLVAAQVFLGAGNISLFIFGLYAPSGSRWEAAKRRYLRSMLHATQQDLVERGPVLAVLAGDFNMPTAEDTVFENFCQAGPWHDCHKCATPDMRNAPTCHQGQGSRIDFILASYSAFDLASCYRVTPLVLFPTHSAVCLDLQMPRASQMRHTLRSAANLPSLVPPKPADALLFPKIPKTFRAALARLDLDAAMRIWNRLAEDTLMDLATSQGHVVQSKVTMRGDIKYQEDRANPPVFADQASTLIDRRLYKAICRAKEVAQAQPGYRRDRTWSLLNEVTQHLPHPYQQLVHEALLAPASPHAAAAVSKHLRRAAEKLASDNRTARIQEWKKQMRKTTAASTSWLKAKAAKPLVKVTQHKGETTAEVGRRLELIQKCWDSVYQAHKKSEPSLHSFMESYGATLSRAMCSLPPLTGDDLRAQLKICKRTCSGPDCWSFEELQSLALWAPSLLDCLSDLLNAVERAGKWPIPLCTGAVSFLPKETDEAFPTPLDHRPITVLSSIYRLWSSTRHSQLATQWQPRWASSRIFGLKGGRSADELVLQTCMTLAEAKASGQHTGGLSFDFQKAFDYVPYGLAINLFRMRGADDNICRALANFYNQHTKIFKLDGAVHPPYRAANGIIQGCPMSMLLLTSLTQAWHEHLSASQPQVESKSYADDLSATTKAATRPLLIAELTKVHQHTQRFADLSGLRISVPKSFSFGDTQLKGKIPGLRNHQTEFRLTGGSVKIGNAKKWTVLEKKRASKWCETVSNIGKLPFGWFAKVKKIQQVMPQLTNGQGTHALAASWVTLRSLRAECVRSLLGTKDYSASPLMVFTLLAPPSLEPEFALQYAALGLFKRFLKCPTARRQLQNALASHPASCACGAGAPTP